MAKETTAGELRTRIVVQRRIPQVNANGYECEIQSLSQPAAQWEPVCTAQCKWENAYGRDVFEAHKAGLSEVATLTMRYTDKVTPTSRILRGTDPMPYEVISVNNVLDRGVWLEIKVHRKVASL